MLRRITGKFAYLSTWFGLAVGCRIAKQFPRAVFWLTERLASFAFFSCRGFRNRSVSNLCVALSDRLNRQAIDQVARRSLENFFRACVETAIAVKSTDAEFRTNIPLVGREHLDAALAKGNGVLVLSAHLGNFFLLGSRLAIENYPTFVLVNQPRSGQFAEMMDYYRLQVRQRTIHSRPRREALRELSRILRLNQIAVMIADEFRKDGGIEVPFFKGTVFARRGPVTLALRTGAALVPACVYRQADGTLKLIIEPELELDRTSKGTKQVKENTLRMTGWLEQTVQAHPDQWNWMNVRWWQSKNQNNLQSNEQ